MAAGGGGGPHELGEPLWQSRRTVGGSLAVAVAVVGARARRGSRAYPRTPSFGRKGPSSSLRAYVEAHKRSTPIKYEHDSVALSSSLYSVLYFMEETSKPGMGKAVTKELTYEGRGWGVARDQWGEHSLR